MATQVRLLGWEASGLRCPDHEVHFEQEDGGVVSPVTLIQMPNGTGKTTTLTLLRMALSGAGPDGDHTPEDVLAFQKQDASTDRGRFVVHISVNEQRCSFVLDFDFDLGTLDRFTTLASGMKQGFHPPSEFDPFARPDFVQFFVFDGELAEHLISRKHADAARAIDDLFQLDNFLALRNRVEEYWEAAVADRTAKAEKGLTRRQNRVRRLRDRLDELVEERGSLQDGLQRTKEELDRKERQFSDELEEQQEQQRKLQEAQSELKEAEARVRRITARIVELLKNPCTYGPVWVERLHNFKQSLDKVKLPESAAREFFVELSEQEECVCGRPLDEATRSALQDRAEQYMGSENVTFLSAMKTQIGDQFDLQPERHADELDNAKSELREAVEEVSRCKTRRDEIESEAATDDPRLKDVRDDLKKLRERKVELEQTLTAFDDPTDSGRDEDVHGIPVLRKRLTEARNDLAEITDTLELKEKRDVLVQVLEGAHATARAELSAGITADTNERIKELMPENPVRVKEIDQCLVLEGQASGSTGENLTVAYAFLSTLFNRADHSLPFIVDSPANPIDLDIRRQIGSLVPQLADQFVAFTISSEREGFLLRLKEAAPSIEYLTLFNRDNPKVDRNAADSGDVVETQDGVIVRGQQFFESFQVDEEA